MFQESRNVNLFIEFGLFFIGGFIFIIDQSKSVRILTFYFWKHKYVDFFQYFHGKKKKKKQVNYLFVNKPTGQQPRIP